MQAAITLASCWATVVVISNVVDCLSDSFLYNPRLRATVASSVAKGERRAQERSAERRELCGGCHRPPVQCLCASLPPQRIVTANTDVLVLQHPAEFRRKTFSTVPLLPLVLQNVQVCAGHSFEPAQEIAPIREAISRGHELLLLFPGPRARSLDSMLPDGSGMNGLQQSRTLSTRHDDKNNKNDEAARHSNKKKYTLILIDGTWTQARRMVRNSPSLLHCCHQQVQFASNATSIYDAVRNEPQGHCLSTLEACAQALVLLEDKESNDKNNSNATRATHYLHAALQSLVDIQLRYSSSNTGNIVESPAPRFVGRKTKASKKEKRRLELEQELFGPPASVDGDSRVDDLEQPQQQTKTQHDDLEPQQQPRTSIIDLGNGATLRPLVKSDAPFVNSRWPHRSHNSLEMIALQIEFNGGVGCLGIEQERDGKLCASILRYKNGALGMLHVDEAYRRRGYGAALLSEATRRVLQQEDCREHKRLFAYIIDGNFASEQLFAKQGWERADPTVKPGTGKRRAKRKWIKL